MNQADWQGVVDDMRLQSGDNAGLFWPIPITLSAPKATADSLSQGDKVALVAKDGEIMGILTVEESYTIDKAHECQQVFTTTDSEHPGVQQVLNQDEVNIAGSVEVLSEGEFPTLYPEIYKTPAETRAILDAKGWKTVAAFQTRNPMHRSRAAVCMVDYRQPNSQPNAPLTRIFGQDCYRDLRWGIDSFTTWCLKAW